MILTESQTFETAEAGVVVARAIHIYDLGTQTSTYEGKETKARKLLLGFENLGEERRNDGSPFVHARRVTASLSPKATLRAMIGQWRGKALTDDEVKAGFDIKKLLGVYCLLNLTEVEKDGKTYLNIAGISPLPKGMPKPEGVSALQLFDLNKPDWELYDTLGERIQAQIAASPEYHAAQGWGQPDPDPKTAAASTPPANGEAFGEDDIPF